MGAARQTEGKKTALAVPSLFPQLPPLLYEKNREAVLDKNGVVWVT